MKKSAGILPFRHQGTSIEVMLVHPGGPFWKNKDTGAWSIAKGELLDDEEPLNCALREFMEETGIELKGKFIELKPVKQKSGKLVLAWAIKKNFGISKIKSNNFNLEWPRGSGKFKSFPEIDKAGWFPIDIAKEKIIGAQLAFIDELIDIINT